MKTQNRFLRVLVWIISILVILALVLVIAGYSYLRFFVLPKLNKNVDSDDKISVSDITKEFGDKQIIENIINFDKESASEMLGIITEIEEETQPEKSNTQSGNNSTETTNNEKEPETNVSKEGTTAYERIVNEASKEEVSQGAAILSKINMAKVNELRKKGDTAALKAYIKSVLSSSEISAALKLYNKYKHLL